MQTVQRDGEVEPHPVGALCDCMVHEGAQRHMNQKRTEHDPEIIEENRQRHYRNQRAKRWGQCDPYCSAMFVLAGLAVNIKVHPPLHQWHHRHQLKRPHQMRKSEGIGHRRGEHQNHPRTEHTTYHRHTVQSAVIVWVIPMWRVYNLLLEPESGQHLYQC